MENNDRTLTCFYCGMEFPSGTLPFGDKLLTDHIKVCEKHPIRRADETIKSLQNALLGLIGAESIDELDQIEAGVRLLFIHGSIPDDDFKRSIDAICALRNSIKNSG